MTSVGYTNPISSSGGKSINLTLGVSKLGGGIPGFIPQATYNTNNNNEFIDTRFLSKHGTLVMP